jgi:hypothetical protein
MKRILLSVALLIAAWAKGPVDPVNRDRSGVALSGYDAVAYFEGGPAKGSPQFTHEWMDAKWRFASAERLERFQADPAKYAPQFGGYCAWAVSNNYTAGVDPEAWKIVDGKLYLNYSKGVQKMWEKDIEKRIRDGHRNWPGLHR